MDACAVRGVAQFDRFREIVSDTFLSINFARSGDLDGFTARFHSRPIGSTVATLAHSSGPGHILSAHRDHRLIAAEVNDHAVFMIERHGTVRHTQYGRTVDTPPGHMILIDSREPYHVGHRGGATSLNVRVPIALLRSALGAPERYCATPIDGRQGTNAVLADFLFAAWRRAKDLGIGEQTAMSDRIIEAISAICMSATSRSTFTLSAGALHFDRAMRYIETHLGDTDLNADRVATALGISTGHLHAVMRSKGTSIGKAILNTRLDRCKAALEDGRQRGQTVGRIAYDWGFADAPHFSRSFKSRFGITPRACRAQAHRKPPATGRDGH